MKQKGFLTAVLLGVFFMFFLFSSHAPASAEEAATGAAIKWAMKVKPVNGTVDLVLTDAGTGRPITKAKVTAVITLPDGSNVTKELKSVKTGKTRSFAGTVDFSMKGVYIFDVDVKAGRKKVKFSFRYEVKH